jgi:hypothetical protein
MSGHVTGLSRHACKESQIETFFKVCSNTTLAYQDMRVGRDLLKVSSTSRPDTAAYIDFLSSLSGHTLGPSGHAA